MRFALPRTQIYGLREIRRTHPASEQLERSGALYHTLGLQRID